MKKHPSSGSASVSTTVKKVSQSTVSYRAAREFGHFCLLYIIYIFSGNTDALTQSPVCRGFKRVSIRVSINSVRNRRAFRVLAFIITDAPLSVSFVPHRFSISNEVL